MATKYNHWMSAAPHSPTATSTGRSRAVIRTRPGFVTRSATSSPIAAPVHRRAVRRAGVTPASRTTFDTLPATPNRIDPATTSANPRAGRSRPPERSGAPGAGRIVSGVGAEMAATVEGQARRGVVCCTAQALPSGSVK